MKTVDKIKETRTVYRRLFNTRDGQFVLEDLKRQFYDNPMDGVDISREVGQRDVVRKILQNIREDNG